MIGRNHPELRPLSPSALLGLQLTKESSHLGYIAGMGDLISFLAMTKIANVSTEFAYDPGILTTLNRADVSELRIYINGASENRLPVCMRSQIYSTYLFC